MMKKFIYRTSTIAILKVKEIGRFSRTQWIVGFKMVNKPEDNTNKRQRVEKVLHDCCYNAIVK